MTIVIGLNVYSDLQYIPCNASVEAEKRSMDSSGGGDAQGTCFLRICFCHQYYFNDTLLGKCIYMYRFSWLCIIYAFFYKRIPYGFGIELFIV